MKNKIVSICLLFCILLGICCLNACKMSVVDNGNPTVVCSNFAAYDFCRQICRDNCNVIMLLPPGTESHSYEPTPSDMAQLQNCDLLICGGGESESWLDRVLDSQNKDIRQFSMMDAVELLLEEHTEGMEAEEEEESEYDEHVWTSPVCAIKISESIFSAVCEIDPENKDSYRTGYDALRSDLEALDAEFRSIAECAVNKTVIFADRFPFRYLFAEYGIEYYAAFPGCSGMTEPGAKTVAFLCDKLNEQSLPCVFITEFSNGSIAQTVASGNVKTLRMHSCHNVSATDFKNGVTYTELMKRNAENLKFALGEEYDESKLYY